MDAVGAWPHPWAPFDCRRGVAAPLARVWPPWGRDCSPGPREAAVMAWPVPWAMCGGMAAPVGFVWMPWGRGRSLGPGLTAVEAWPLS